jgi:thymidylate synthase ThyX
MQKRFFSMSPKRQVYLLDPQKLDPETIAVAFAKTSRSPQSFRTIAAELTTEKSAEFHEKWVVGYGHSSVAEHAVLHVAVENVSRLAVETIESNRLASYTEKSTRYQKWGMGDFFVPPELEDHPLQSVYETTCQVLFQAYHQILPAVKANVERDFPCQPGESESAWERRIRSEYVDVCRFLLPAASLANLGMTINARALEHALRKMLSHPLQEVQQIGLEIKQAAFESVPTLIKYVDRVSYLEDTSRELENLAGSLGLSSEESNWCRLVSYDSLGEDRILAAALYRFGNISYANSFAYIQSLGETERARLAQMLMGRLGKHDIPLRETEFARYSFDVLVDQGAYFELKRHRMMTQTPQALTALLGYSIPQRIVAAGVEDIYRQAMEAVQPAYTALAAYNPHAAAYCVPNGYNRRVLLDFNLRTADHFVSLRSAPNAHFSIRRLALRMAEEIRAATPLLGQYLRANSEETWQQIEQSYFAQV